MFVLVWLHLLAAIAWIGGMVFLSVVLVPILKAKVLVADRGILFRAIAQRFRQVVWTSVALLGLTGLLLLKGRGLSLLHPSGWPTVFRVKLTLVALLLLFVLAHDFFVGPRVASIRALAEPERTKMDRALIFWAPWTARLLLLLALAILMLGVWLARI